ncbi:DUF6508 domain-containing protein [Paenibacillus sanfengchensis]|uniref:DUF6508 domain-containing protein n=1 Tax=Paenibacillus sanfengchensis TaxID=3119819 RepID=UPI002FE275EA
MSQQKELTKQEIESLISFLDYFQNTDNTFYEVVNGYYRESPEVRRFREELDRTGFLIVFNWHEWLAEHKVFTDLAKPIEEPVRSADLDTLRKLMTSYIRGDRYNEGLFIQAILNGHITCILLRLKALKD